MVRHAAYVVSRYARGADGVTAYRAAYDRNFNMEMVPSGETVLFKEPSPHHRQLCGGRR